MIFQYFMKKNDSYVQYLEEYKPFNIDVINIYIK